MVAILQLNILRHASGIYICHVNFSAIQRRNGMFFIFIGMYLSNLSMFLHQDEYKFFRIKVDMFVK